MESQLPGNYFLVIGAQKAGTTWLHEFLTRHPDAWVPPIKELHYFDEVATGHSQRSLRLANLRSQIERLQQPVSDYQLDRLKWSASACFSEPVDDAWYVRHMSVGAAWRAYGELTPAYATLSTEGFGHIRRLAPRVRLVFVMRDPVQRVWSQIRMDAAKANDPTLLEPGAVRRLIEQPHPYHARTDYVQTIERVLKVFPREQLLLLFYEDLKAEPATFVTRLTGFLGIEFDSALLSATSTRSNVSPSHRMPDSVRRALLDRYGPMTDALQALAGRIPESWSTAPGKRSKE